MLKLKRCSHSKLHEYYSIMQNDFTSIKLPPEIVFHKALFQHQIDLVLVVDDTVKVTIAYAVVCPESLYGYGLLMNFSVMPWYRENGLGDDALRLIERHYGKLRGMLVEIPEGKSAKQTGEFFGKMGYKYVKTGEYYNSGVKTKVMARLSQSAPNPSPVIHRIIPEIYGHIYSETTVKKMIDIKPVK